MEFLSLASSSKANAYLVCDGDTKLLLECGLAYKELLKHLSFKLSEISGCLISHEHKDHSRCAKNVLEAGVPVYTSYGTAESLGLSCVNIIEEKEMFSVGTFDIIPFFTFHDAKEPMGFYIRSRTTNKRLLFATDTAAINYEFSGLNTIAIECNYIRDVLERALHLPEKVVYRIKQSHMEAHETLRYLTTLDMSKAENIYLLHLSDACSDAGRILSMFSETFPDTKIVICDK